MLILRFAEPRQLSCVFMLFTGSKAELLFPLHYAGNAPSNLPDSQNTLQPLTCTDMISLVKINSSTSKENAG